MPKPNRDYLRTWRTINESMPDEVRTPFRSHVSAPPAKIGPNKGLSRIDTPIPEKEPNAGNWSDLILKRTPLGKAAELASDPGNLFGGPLDEVGKAVSWFGTKAARQASGDNLIKILRSRHAEGTPMRAAVEKAYTNYPRTFAHLSDIDTNVSNRTHRGTHFPEWGADQKFLDVPIHDVHGDPAGTVPKLKTTRQTVLADEKAVDDYIRDVQVGVPQAQNPRSLAINNRLAVRPDVLETPQGEVTFRHELGHAAQNIRRPKEHIADIEAGRGQISGLHNPGTDLPHLDYKLEPVEVGARFGQEKGLNKGTRPSKKHADIINDEIERIISDYKVKTGYAKETPLYQENYGYSGPGKGKKVYPSKTELAKSEPKVLAAAFAKIQNQVLPRFNKSRPASDPLVFTLNGTVIPKIEGLLKKPEALGDFIRDIRVQRLSQVK